MFIEGQIILKSDFLIKRALYYIFLFIKYPLKSRKEEAKITKNFPKFKIVPSTSVNCKNTLIEGAVLRFWYFQVILAPSIINFVQRYSYLYWACCW